MSTPLRDVEEVQFYCPACHGQVNPEWPEPADSLHCGVCGQALWFVERPMNETCVVVAPVTELINEGDTVKQVGEVLAAAGNRRRLVVDLSRLRFLPNSVIKVLLALQRRLRALGGSLTICGLHPANYHALRRARLTTVLNICDDPEVLFDC